MTRKLSLASVDQLERNQSIQDLELNCAFKEIEQLMIINKLKLNRDKTELPSADAHTQFYLYWNWSGGTQRLLSINYLFGEGDMAKNFLLLENGLKFLDDRSIHVQFS